VVDSEPLKVLTLSSNDLSGSRFNGHDLHEGLKSRGIETTHRSFWEKSSAAPWSGQVFDRKDVRLLAPFIRRLEYRTGMQNRFQYWTSGLLRDPSFLQADVIHLNIIHDHWFRFETILEIARRKPTVWTWHDLWPVTGHCIQPGQCPRWEVGCGKCPALDLPLAVGRDRTDHELQRKLRILNELNLDIHVTTGWMRHKLERFLPFPNGSTIHVIPFGINAQGPSVVAKEEARTRLGIPPHSRVILARSTKDPIKQFHSLVQTLSNFESGDVELMVLAIGDRDVVEPTWRTFGNLKCLLIPWVTDSSSLTSYFNAADVTYHASVGESFGMLALESMARGTPVITTAGTATAEVTGMPELEIPPDHYEKTLTQIATKLVTEPQSFLNLGSQALGRVEHSYSVDSYLDAMAELYWQSQKSFLEA